MKTHIQNKFHNFSRTITHRGETPPVRVLRAVIRDSKPSDCTSETRIVREDGARLAIREDGRNSRVEIVG